MLTIVKAVIYMALVSGVSVFGVCEMAFILLKHGRRGRYLSSPFAKMLVAGT